MNIGNHEISNDIWWAKKICPPYLANDSIESLALAVGNPATAVFKAGAVVIGVASD